MKKPSGKEISRRLKRNNATNEIRRKYSAPKIEIHAQLASPSFKKQVESTLATIDFDKPPFEHEEIGLFFQNLSQLGLEKSYKVLSDALVKRLSKVQYNGPPRRIEADPLQLAVHALGDFIVDSLCNIDESIFPMNDVEVRIQGNGIHLGLSSMLHREVDDYDIYISRKRLQVEVDGNSYTLAFRDHCIESICSRYRPDFVSYDGLAEAHALFSYLNYVEPTVLPAGNKAVSLFDFCLGPGTWQYDNYVGRCLPGAPVRGPKQWHPTGKPYGYRLGYCPIKVIDKYAVAWTFLPPGFSKTPERRLLRENCHDRKLKGKLIQVADQMGYNTLRYGRGFDAIEWFHKNGIPQVIDPPIPLFDYEYRIRKFGDST